jgi:anti-sigma factor RsiW
MLGKKRMHAVVMESLEEYLAGSLEPADERAIEAHLIACDSCREEVHGMREVSQLLGSLRSEEAFESSPAFLAGVMRQVADARGAARSLPNFLGIDLAFGRRLAFASLLTLAMLGGYLVSHESDYLVNNGVSPESLLAQQDSPAFASGPAQDNMLVTLTAYDRH